MNNTTGSNNTAAGVGAGSSLTTGDNNIDIGNSGVDGESDTIRIGSEFQTRTFIAVIRVTTGIADAVNVVIAQIQKVSAQLEVSRPAPQTVLNNQ